MIRPFPRTPRNGINSFAGFSSRILTPVEIFSPRKNRENTSRLGRFEILLQVAKILGLVPHHGGSITRLSAFYLPRGSTMRQDGCFLIDPFLFVTGINAERCSRRIRITRLSGSIGRADRVARNRVAPSSSALGRLEKPREPRHSERQIKYNELCPKGGATRQMK